MLARVSALISLAFQSLRPTDGRPRRFYRDSNNRAMKSAERKTKFEVGLAHFNARKFFEAHEFWEEIWLVEAEPDKTFLQGLIQITAAFHHHQRGNLEGAESLLTAGIVKLLRFPDDHRGLTIGALRESAKRWARALGMGDDLGKKALPKLKRIHESAEPHRAAKKRRGSSRTKARR
jgi:predicted metal-dependent hydrolase